MSLCKIITEFTHYSKFNTKTYVKLTFLDNIFQWRALMFRHLPLYSLELMTVLQWRHLRGRSPSSLIKKRTILHGCLRLDSDLGPLIPQTAHLTIVVAERRIHNIK